MQKFLVIDSIARSGTTLLSALIRTQDKCATFDGSFVEPILWEAKRKSLDVYKKDTMFMVGGSHSGSRLSAGLSKSDWGEILNDLSSWDDIDKFYTRLSKKFESDIIGFRWNHCLPYISEWISRSLDHYWVTIVRDPRDRSVSNLRTHGWSSSMCINRTRVYGKLLDNLEDTKQLLVIYYEDLVANPQKTLYQIFKLMGVQKDYPLSSLEVENLVGANYKSYRQQGWRVKGDHRKGQAFQGIHHKSIGQYKNELGKNITVELNSIIKEYNVYSRYRKKY